MIRVGNGPVCVVQLCLKKRKTNNSRLIYDSDVWNYRCDITSSRADLLPHCG